MNAHVDVSFYRENGYLVIPDVLSSAEIETLRRVTDELVAASAAVTSHTDVYDLEDSHTPTEPRVRRIKTPHKVHPEYARLVNHPGIIEVLQQLLSESIRFDGSKLNMKAAGYGAPVEWHQDWAFYPHTNDDLAAIGIMLDDCDLENGPLMVLPGSHRGPIYDHHRDGYFCGAIDLDACGLDVSGAVPLTGAAGSISIHHVRTVHGSAPNHSGKPRRLLLHQYAAGDAWPLKGVDDFDAWQAKLITGQNTVEPRQTQVPVRLPLPPAQHSGSIYENQRALGRSFFAPVEGATPEAAGTTAGAAR